MQYKTVTEKICVQSISEHQQKYESILTISGRAEYYNLKVLCSLFDLLQDCGLTKVIIY